MPRIVTPRNEGGRLAVSLPSLVRIQKGPGGDWPGPFCMRTVVTATSAAIAAALVYLGGTFSPQSILPLSRQSMMCQTSWFRMRSRLAVWVGLMMMRPLWYSAMAW